MTSLTHQAKPKRRSTPQASLVRITEILAAQSHVLLETAWLGWTAHYRFRCAQGHELARSLTQITRVPIACPACREAKALARLKDIARQAEGECLSEHYAGHLKCHAFRCAQGHLFDMQAAVVVSGSWCRRCAYARNAEKRRDPKGLERLRKMAQQQGGECLSTNYTRQRARYAFCCARGHTWETTGDAVIGGVWCGLCAAIAKSEAYRHPQGLAELQRIALSRNGLCLAQSYTNSHAYYEFRCEKGHEWRTMGSQVFRGSWCTTCGHERQRLGIALMQNIAAERGGRCVSEVYVNGTTKLEWECLRGHRWHAPPSTVRAGHWCGECHYLSRITLEKTRRLRRHECA